MSQPAVAPRPAPPRTISDAMQDEAMAVFGSEREIGSKSDPAGAPDPDGKGESPLRRRRPPKHDWVGIITLSLGLLLAFACIYSALTSGPTAVPSAHATPSASAAHIGSK